MKQNKYDDNNFFTQYSQMARSTQGLSGAGEWQTLQAMLPDFHGKSVLDLGCGFGWHCRYAAEHGAKTVVGTDISEKMLAKARELNQMAAITYQHVAMEDLDFPADSFDCVISSLAFHYIASFDGMCRQVHAWLKSGGDFVFSVEHPVFTAQGKQDWHYDSAGNRACWPVDNYYREGRRDAVFLGENVIKYHKTLTTYINSLLTSGFDITQLIEPQPPENWLDAYPEMQDELRRPLFLIIAARKK